MACHRLSARGLSRPVRSAVFRLSPVVRHTVPHVSSAPKRAGYHSPGQTYSFRPGYTCAPTYQSPEGATEMRLLQAPPRPTTPLPGLRSQILISEISDPEPSRSAVSASIWSAVASHRVCARDLSRAVWVTAFGLFAPPRQGHNASAQGQPHSAQPWVFTQ